ncbi:MAG: TonB-dependent receptor [Pseudomonadales bacterium]|nr:TonB-dependent receptor [Pseudomonadales bacterium]
MNLIKKYSIAFFVVVLMNSHAEISANDEVAKTPLVKSKDSTSSTKVLSESLLKNTRLRELGNAGYANSTQILSTLLPYFHSPQVSGTGVSDHFQPPIFRALAPDHYLVLVNGKRRHSAAQLHVNDMAGSGSQSVDLNMIPAVAIEYVEISRQGASARYGSEAISGVMNFKLKEGKGGSFSAHLGTHITEVTDVPDLLSVTQAGGQLIFLSSGDRNPDDGDGNTLTLAGDWGFTLGTSGFVHFSAEYRDREATDRTGFDPRQQFPSPGPGLLDIREQTFDRFSHRHGQADIEDFNFFVNAAYPLSDQTELYFFGSHGKRKGRSGLDYLRALDARNLTNIYPHGTLPLVESDVDDISVTLGTRSQLFGWHLDVSYTDANNEIDLFLENSLNPSLGVNSPLKFSVGNNENHQQVFNVDISRTIEPGLLTVPVSLFAGIEYRLQSYEIERGESASFINGGFNNEAGLPGATGSQGLHGIRPQDEFDEGRENKSVYLRLVTDLSEALGVAISTRYDDYTDVGGQVSGKLATQYRINEALLVHASVGNGFRAPGIAQRYYAATLPRWDAGQAVDSGIYGVDSAVAKALGSAELDFEKSLDFNAGVELGLFAGRLSILADLYQINIDDRIVLSKMLTGTSVADLLQVAGITSVDGVRYFHNGLDTRTRGVDFSASYTFDLASHGELALSAGLNINETSVKRIEEAPELLARGINRFGLREQRSLERGVPESKLILNARWNKDRMSATFRITGIGSTVIAAEQAALDQKLDALWLVDLDMRYQATKNIHITLGSNNVLDTYPDVVQTGESFSEQIFPFSNFSPYGYNGRYVYASITSAF